MSLKYFCCSFFILCSMKSIVEANCPPCLEAPKIYEELQCVGGKSQGDCCDTKYNCSSTVEKIRAGAKCILQGTEIGIGEKVSVDLLPPCVSEAKCVSSPNGPKFDYVSRDVPKLEEGCLPQYSLDDLCVPKKLICDENGKKNLAKCESHGHVYHEGELFSHPSFSVFSAACYSCVCDGQFDNSTIPSMNKNCRKLDCGIEIYNIEKIRNGCVPVFRSNGASSSEVTECCPVNWICPEINKDKTYELSGDAKSCQFGNNVIPKYSPDPSPLDENCTTCTCQKPPVLHCQLAEKC